MQTLFSTDTNFSTNKNVIFYFLLIRKIYDFFLVTQWVKMISDLNTYLIKTTHEAHDEGNRPTMEPTKIVL